VKRLRVGVIYGGRSGEHEVSLASAASVIANLDKKRYEAVPIRIEKDGRWTLPDRPPTASRRRRDRSGAARRARSARASREVQMLARPVVTRSSRRSARQRSGIHLERTPVTGSRSTSSSRAARPYGEDGTVQASSSWRRSVRGCGVLASASAWTRPP